MTAWKTRTARSAPDGSVGDQLANRPVGACAGQVVVRAEDDTGTLRTRRASPDRRRRTARAASRTGRACRAAAASSVWSRWSSFMRADVDRVDVVAGDARPRRSPRPGCRCARRRWPPSPASGRRRRRPRGRAGAWPGSSASRRRRWRRSGPSGSSHGSPWADGAAGVSMRRWPPAQTTVPARMIAAPFSPIMIDGAWVFPRDERRHDRGVDDAQPGHAVDAQLGVHDGHRVAAHLARADRVVVGLRPLLDVLADARRPTSRPCRAGAPCGSGP